MTSVTQPPFHLSLSHTLFPPAYPPFFFFAPLIRSIACSYSSENRAGKMRESTPKWRRRMCKNNRSARRQEEPLNWEVHLWKFLTLLPSSSFFSESISGLFAHHQTTAPTHGVKAGSRYILIKRSRLRTCSANRYVKHLVSTHGQVTDWNCW